MIKRQDWMPLLIYDEYAHARNEVARASRREYELGCKLTEFAKKILKQHAYCNSLGFQLEFGWDCPESPIGTCLYEWDDEHCVLCGEPSERK